MAQSPAQSSTEVKSTAGPADAQVIIEAETLARTSEEEKSTDEPVNGKFTQWILDRMPQEWRDAYEATMETKMEEVGPSASYRDFFKVLMFGTKLDFWLIFACGVSALVAGVAMPLMFLILGELVNDFTGYFIPGSGVTRDEFMDSVTLNSLIIFALFWARFIFSYISFYTIRVSGLRISSAIRLAYIQALLKQPQAVVDAVSPGTIASRITASANTINTGISQQFAIFLQAVALMLGSYIISFTKAWLLTFVASASLPFILIVYMIVIPFFIKWYRDLTRYSEKASALAFEIFTSIRIVAAFCAEGRLSKKHEEYLDRVKQNDLKIAPLMGLAFSPVMFAMFSTYSLTFYFGIKQFSDGHLDSVGSIVTVLFSVMTAVMSVSMFVGPLIYMAKVASAASDILITIEADLPDTSGAKGPDVPSDRDITFKDVCFAYPSRRNVQVLDNVFMTFEAKKTTAIVGPSGSGKSTIVGLLERHYDLADFRVPKKFIPIDVIKARNAKKEKNGLGQAADTPEPPIGGKIFVGEKDLSTIDAKWWRAQIGLVGQEPFLFNDTIYTNVAYGLSGTDGDDLPIPEKEKLVEDACRQAFADEFISRLPQGYNTMVGEAGIKLSGGQRQRLAIARAIIKKPTILILDEATSAIDVRTEGIVQAALDRASEGRTTIVIAHRLATIKRADKIIVMRKGKVEEQGTHQELLQIEDGIYHGLVRAQNIEMGAEQQAKEEEFEVEDERAEQLSKCVSKTRAEEIEVESDGIVTKDGAIAGYKKRGFFGTFGTLIYEQTCLWKQYVFLVLGCCGAGAAFPVQAYIFAQLIDVFTIFDRDRLVDRGNFWALMFFVLACALFVMYYMLTWAAHSISANIIRTYRQEYLRNLLRKRIAFFDAEGNSPGSLSSRLASDTTQIESVLGGQMSMAYVSVFNLVGSLIISFYFGWKLALVSTCVLLPALLGAGFVRVRLEMKFEDMNAAVFAESSQFAVEAIGAFRTVTSLVLEQKVIDRYNNLMTDHVALATKKALTWTLAISLSQSIDMACQAFILWYGGTLLADREYDLVSYFTIYSAITQGGQAAGVLFSFAPNIANATAGANRILSSRHVTPEIEHEPKSERPSETDSGITFDDVRFSYKSRNLTVLNGLDLSIKPGQFVALVGATGCGKSTTISLLERFYDADSGSILYGEQNIRELNVPAYRSNFALVAQESTLYEGSIRENVCLSVDETDATDETLYEACRAAQIHDFIVSLPEGYATQLGPKGVSLSGGQRQRLALARAMMRNPRVLLLDEATSSLDSESEKLVQQAIDKAAGEGTRTIIAVAHRLATIQKADLIFVLGSGKVLESGSHRELLEARGVYYSMCQSQALDR